jgi:hypothetical protein
MSASYFSERSIVGILVRGADGEYRGSQEANLADGMDILVTETALGPVAVVGFRAADEDAVLQALNDLLGEAALHVPTDK